MIKAIKSQNQIEALKKINTKLNNDNITLLCMCKDLLDSAKRSVEALNIICKEEKTDCPKFCYSTDKYCHCKHIDEECDTSNAYLCWAEYYKQQAEERLKEEQ